MSKKSHRYKTKPLALKLISIHQVQTRGFILYNQNQKILTESVVLFNGVMDLIRRFIYILLILNGCMAGFLFLWYVMLLSAKLGYHYYYIIKA